MIAQKHRLAQKHRTPSHLYKGVLSSMVNQLLARLEPTVKAARKSQQEVALTSRTTGHRLGKITRSASNDARDAVIEGRQRGQAAMRALRGDAPHRQWPLVAGAMITGIVLGAAAGMLTRRNQNQGTEDGEHPDTPLRSRIAHATTAAQKTAITAAATARAIARKSTTAARTITTKLSPTPSTAASTGHGTAAGKTEKNNTPTLPVTTRTEIKQSATNAADSASSTLIASEEGISASGPTPVNNRL